MTPPPPPTVNSMVDRGFIVMFVASIQLNAVTEFFLCERGKLHVLFDGKCRSIMGSVSKGKRRMFELD